MSNKKNKVRCPSCGAEIAAGSERCPYCGAVNAYASEAEFQKGMDALTRKVRQGSEQERRIQIRHELIHELILILITICIFLVLLGILYLVVSRIDARNLENLRSVVSHGL